MRKLVWIFAFVIALLSFELYKLAPKYPEGHENVTFKRVFIGSLVHAFFKLTVLAERIGLVEESANVIQYLFFFRVARPPPPDGVSVEYTTIADRPVVIFRPNNVSPTNSKAIVYFHGGGFVICSPASHYAWTLHLANSTNSVVISVDYRLAPGHPYPAAVDDSLAVTKAVFESAESLGIDRNRIGVAGDSAGGNLAAVTAIELAKSQKYKLKAQILISPALVAAGVSFLPSYVHYGENFFLHLDWFIVKYAGVRYSREVENAILSEHHVSVDELETIRHHLNISSLPEDLLALIPDVAYAKPRSSGASAEEMARRPQELAVVGKLALDQRAWPLIQEDEQLLRSLPATLIQVCAFDPLRDEGLLYFNRLRNLNVSTKLSFLPNAIHAEPLFRYITGATPSKAGAKGSEDILRFINDHL